MATHSARRQACRAHKHLLADVLYPEVVAIQVAVLPSVESQAFASLLLEGYSNSLPLKGGSMSPQISPVLLQALPCNLCRQQLGELFAYISGTLSAVVLSLYPFALSVAT